MTVSCFLFVGKSKCQTVCLFPPPVKSGKYVCIGSAICQLTNISQVLNQNKLLDIARAICVRLHNQWLIYTSSLWTRMSPCQHVCSCVV